MKHWLSGQAAGNMDIDIAEGEVEDTLYRSRPFVEIIICSLEGRQQTDKPVPPGASGWNELGITVCWMTLLFIARYRRDIYVSKTQFANKCLRPCGVRKGNCY